MNKLLSKRIPASASEDHKLRVDDYIDAVYYAWQSAVAFDPKLDLKSELHLPDNNENNDHVEKKFMENFDKAMCIAWNGLRGRAVDGSKHIKYADRYRKRETFETHFAGSTADVDLPSIEKSHNFFMAAMFHKDPQLCDQLIYLSPVFSPEALAKRDPETVLALPNCRINSEVVSYGLRWLYNMYFVNQDECQFYSWISKHIERSELFYVAINVAPTRVEIELVPKNKHAEAIDTSTWPNQLRDAMFDMVVTSGDTH